LGFLIFVSTTVLMIIYSIKFFIDDSGFEPKYETVQIEQDVGGKLICNSVYDADHHSWNYHIRYTYVNSDNDTLDFKTGLLFGRKWDKHEQLHRHKNLLILKTGSSIGTDRIVVKNMKSDSTIVYDISPESIEKDKVWKFKKMPHRSDRCCSTSYVEDIKGNSIVVKYRFRTLQHSDEYDEKLVWYKIDGKSGELKMIRID